VAEADRAALPRRGANRQQPLREFYKSGSTTSGAYGRASTWKLKADAPAEAVEILSENLFVPLLERLLADGAIVEYEIDEETIHTESPDMFFVYILAPTADGLDKFNAAVRDGAKNNPLIGPHSEDYREASFCPRYTRACEISAREASALIDGLTNLPK